MYDTAFDQLTKSIGDGVSRRGLLRALAGGGFSLGLLGWTAGPDAAAKSCKKIKDKKKRRACRKNAQGGTDQLPAPPLPPVGCPDGTVSLAGRCALGCGETCLARPGVCGHTFDDSPICVSRLSTCAEVPKVCSSHADCTAQELCTLTSCITNDQLSSRCVPFLS